MASVQLKCSICLNNDTDPVQLRCGHNFCRVCIDRVLDTQGGSGGYSCPECREKFQDRPALHRNMKCNTGENFQSAESDQEESEVFCSHCVDSPVPAVRSCLLCEVSLCDKHLRVHKRSPEHILCDPTLSMESRKCSVHKKILEYYCTEDETPICVSCCLIGGHKGHEIKSLDEASEKKKETLRNVLPKLLTKREETEERVQSLQEHWRKVKEEAAGDTERVTVLFRDLRRRLEDLEKRILREISGRAERISISIRDLEIKKEELSRKMRHIEEQCNMTDPLTVLQESDTGDLCDTEDGDNEDRERHEKLLHGRGLDVAGISHTLHTGLSDIITEVNVFPIQGAADILLDVNTAHNSLQISDDGKTVSRSDIDHNYSETPERFQNCAQVLSSQSFSSGRHYWEVDFGGSHRWRVGMCYPSIDRRGRQSGIGNNNKSWCLYKDGGLRRMVHNSNKISLSTKISSNRVRIYLDYEAGRISFYDLCDPIQRLHTFTATFTEPLHAGIGVWKGCIKICGGNQEMGEICPETGDITGRMSSAKNPEQGEAVAADPTKKGDGTQQHLPEELNRRAAASLAKFLTRMVLSDDQGSSSGLEQDPTMPSRGGTAEKALRQNVTNWKSNTVGATKLVKGFSDALGEEPVVKNLSSVCQASGGKLEKVPAAMPAVASIEMVPEPQPEKFQEETASRTPLFHPVAQTKDLEEPMEESGMEGPIGPKTKGSIEGKEQSNTRGESDEETASPSGEHLKWESAALERIISEYSCSEGGVRGQAELAYTSASDLVNHVGFGFTAGNSDFQDIFTGGTLDSEIDSD